MFHYQQLRQQILHQLRLTGQKQLARMPVNVERSAARKLICETEEKKKKLPERGT